MQENINITTWAKIVQQIGFAEALVLILLAILFLILAWFFFIHSRKLDRVVEAIYCLKRSMDKLLNIEEIKSRIRRDPAASEISKLVNGKDKAGSPRATECETAKKGRLNYEKAGS